MARTEIKITGTAELCALLQGLREDMRADMLGRAVDAGAEPILQGAKRMVPVGTGALRNSLTKAVRKDQEKGTAYAIIGPDRAYYQDGQRINGRLGNKFARFIGSSKPANYAHLVEFGHRIAAKGAESQILRKARRSPGTQDILGQTSGVVPAKPFMRPAVMAGAAEAADIMAGVIDAELGRAINKRKRIAAKAA